MSITVNLLNFTKDGKKINTNNTVSVYSFSSLQLTKNTVTGKGDLQISLIFTTSKKCRTLLVGGDNIPIGFVYFDGDYKRVKQKYQRILDSEEINRNE